MSILGGVATALVLVTVVIIVTMRLRCNHLHHNHHLHHHHDANDQTWKTSEGGATTENSSSGSSIDLQQADLELRASPGIKLHFYETLILSKKTLLRRTHF